MLTKHENQLGTFEMSIGWVSLKNGDKINFNSRMVDFTLGDYFLEITFNTDNPAVVQKLQIDKDEVDFIHMYK